MYRVGLLGWKIAARLGFRVGLRIFIEQDLEANVYIAHSPDLPGLLIEGSTLEEIKNEALACSKILLQEALHKPAPVTNTRFILETIQPAEAGMATTN